MIEKLEKLKLRAQNLKYSDQGELDDIKRKTKMIFSQAFQFKSTYEFEVDAIKFTPQYAYDGADRPAWKEGQEKLVNLIDTRIEELQINAETIKKQHKEVKIVEKKVFIENTEKITELTKELWETKSNAQFWRKINWSVYLTIIGGAFALGIFIGNYHFDKEKNELFEKNKELNSENERLKSQKK